MQKEIMTIATDKWTDAEILESLVYDLAFKGFGSGIGSQKRDVKVTIIIESMDKHYNDEGE